MKYIGMANDPRVHFHFMDVNECMWRLSLFYSIGRDQPYAWDLEKEDKRTLRIQPPDQQILIGLLQHIPQEDISILIKRVLLENDQGYTRYLVNDILQAQEGK